MSSSEQQEEQEQCALSSDASPAPDTTEDDADKKNKPSGVGGGRRRTTKTAERARATALPDEPPLQQLERVESAARQTAAERRAEAARKKREAEERFEEQCRAAGPKTQALLASPAGRSIVSLLVSNGGGVLSAVDLCELAVASRGFAAGAAAFWETCLEVPQQQQTAGAAAATAPPAAAQPPTNSPPAPVTKLALEHDPAHAGKDHTERRAHWSDPKIGCAACGLPLGTAQNDVPPALLTPLRHPICDSCFGGLMTTTFPPSRGPRALLAYSVGVLAPAAAQLFGVSVDEVAAALPHHPRSRSRAFKAERGVRVSLRWAASHFLRKLGGPKRVAIARDLQARSEAAALAQLNDASARTIQKYEAMDAAASERRRHRLRSALISALSSRVLERAPKKETPGTIWRWTGGGPPFDFERAASGDLKRAAAAYVAVGRPPIAAIMAATIKEVEAIEEKEGRGRKKKKDDEDEGEEGGGGGSTCKRGKKA